MCLSQVCPFTKCNPYHEIRGTKCKARLRSCTAKGKYTQHKFTVQFFKRCCLLIYFFKFAFCADKGGPECFIVFIGCHIPIQKGPLKHPQTKSGHDAPTNADGPLFCPHVSFSWNTSGDLWGDLDLQSLPSHGTVGFHFWPYEALSWKPMQPTGFNGFHLLSKMLQHQTWWPLQNALRMRSHHGHDCVVMLPACKLNQSAATRIHILLWQTKGAPHNCPKKCKILRLDLQETIMLETT